MCHNANFEEPALMKLDRCWIHAVAVLVLGLFAVPVVAQNTGQPKAAPTAGAKAATRAASAGAPQANLSQLMKGIFYPASNVIFAAQNDNPDSIKPAADPSTATDPLQSAYGKWQAVENAALALTDAAPLLRIAGRMCSNGVAAPLAKADWAGLVRGLQDAGLKVYAAAKTKDQEKIVDAADAMTTACANCHDKYRDVPKPENRCK
jgi:Cytochrome C'